MKQAAWLLAVVVAGCAGGPSEEEVQGMNKKLEQLENNATTHNEKATYMHRQLVDSLDAYGKRVAKLERTLEVMETALSHLEDKIGKLGTAPPPEPPPNGGTKPEPAPAKPTVEDAIRETDKVLTELRQGRLLPKEAALRLKPMAKLTAPLLVKEMSNAIAKTEYMRKLESILSTFPPKDLEPALQAALKKPATRSSAARIIRKVGDLELSRIIEPHLKDADEDFKLLAGEALITCKNAAGVPPLVRCLRSEHRDTRLIAASDLKTANAGKDFGYDPYKSPEENAKAIESWDEWAKKFGPTIFD